jgi:hypothetical protein
MKKKTLFFVSLFTVLALLFTSCADMLNPPQAKTSGLTITIGEKSNGARTILPENNITFDRYVISFTSRDGNPNFTVPVTENTATVEVPSGNWLITVDGEIDDIAVARGEYELNAYAGNNLSINISIAAIMDETMFGYLKIINIPTDMPMGTMELYKYPYTENEELAYTFTGDDFPELTTFTYEVNAGYYLIRTKSVYEGVEYSNDFDIIHIYPYHTTIIDINDMIGGGGDPDPDYADLLIDNSWVLEGSARLFAVGIFVQSTSLEAALSMNGIVATSDILEYVSEGTIGSNLYTLEGYRWEDNGSFDVYVITDNDNYIYLSNVEFTLDGATIDLNASGTAIGTLPAGTFEGFTGGGGGTKPGDDPIIENPGIIPGSTAYFDSDALVFSTDNTYARKNLQWDDNTGEEFYIDIETGTYTFNETSVTLSPQEVETFGGLLDREGTIAMMNDQLAGMSEAEIAEALEGMGWEGSMEEYIAFMISEYFAPVTYTYSFMEDTSLLMTEELPAISAPITLSGVYTEYISVDDAEEVYGTYDFYTNGRYIFTPVWDEYSTMVEGFYTANSESVYLKPIMIDAKTIEEIAEVYGTAYANGTFGIEVSSYDSVEMIIGGGRMGNSGSGPQEGGGGEITAPDA